MSPPQPYFAKGLVTLYCGDAREILPALELELETTVTIVDPVWPNAAPPEDPRALAGAVNPRGLFAEIAANFPKICTRAIVVLGVASDPRFLEVVPASMPYFRPVQLRYVTPRYAGPVMIDRDIAYAFGWYPMPKKGQKVFPGEIMCTTPKGRERPTSHPCPMRYAHAEGLIRGYTRAVDTILDPCAGSGTIVDAAVRNGRRVVAIEIERRYCDEIIDRARIASAQQTLPLEVGA